MNTSLALSTAVALSLSLLAASPARADEEDDCHFHGAQQASEQTVQGCALERRQTLVSNGKIDKSWLNVAPGPLALVEGKRGKEWKLSFTDPAAADKAKQTLYMFFTAQGNFIAANFTGK